MVKSLVVIVYKLSVYKLFAYKLSSYRITSLLDKADYKIPVILVQLQVRCLLCCLLLHFMTTSYLAMELPHYFQG